MLYPYTITQVAGPVEYLELTPNYSSITLQSALIPIPSHRLLELSFSPSPVVQIGDDNGDLKARLPALYECCDFVVLIDRWLGRKKKKETQEWKAALHVTLIVLSFSTVSLG